MAVPMLKEFLKPKYYWNLCSIVFGKFVWYILYFELFDAQLNCMCKTILKLFEYCIALLMMKHLLRRESSLTAFPAHFGASMTETHA